MALTKVSYGVITADASSADLNIDANTLFVDSSANKVGVGTTSPAEKLQSELSESTAQQVTDQGLKYIQTQEALKKFKFIVVALHILMQAMLVSE